MITFKLSIPWIETIMTKDKPHKFICWKPVLQSKDRKLCFNPITIAFVNNRRMYGVTSYKTPNFMKFRLMNGWPT